MERGCCVPVAHSTDRSGAETAEKNLLSLKGQTSPSAFHAKVPILPALPLMGFVPLQVAVIKLQRLYDKIRFLPSGDGFWNELGYPLVLKGRLLFLVRLILLHDALDDLVRELSLLHELFHFDSLCK